MLNRMHNQAAVSNTLTKSMFGYACAGVWLLSDVYSYHMRSFITACRKDIYISLPLAAGNPNLVFPDSSPTLAV